MPLEFHLSYIYNAIALRTKRIDQLMPNEVQVSLRLPATLAERIDGLIALAQSDPDLAWGRVTRSAVLRLALLRGVQALEDHYGSQSTRRTLRSIRGLGAHLRVDISQEDFDRARRESWANFPRDDF